MDTMLLIGGWVAVGLTLFMFSFLYKDNPFFKLGEHLYVGVSVGYMLVQQWYQFLKLKWFEPLFLSDHPDYLKIVPGLFGLLIVLRFVPKLAWLSRYTFALIVGYTAGITIPRALSANLLAQTEGTVKSLITRSPGGALDLSGSALWADFSALVVLIGVLSVLVYFFFSIEHKGAIKATARLGICFLMVSFGAGFGYTVMGRNALLYGRFYDLVDYSAAQYYYATPILLGAMVLALIVWNKVFAKGH